MHWRTYIESEVIRFVDLPAGDHVVQIKEVKRGKVTGAGGKSSGKAMIMLVGKEKPWAAGTAALSVIADLHGNEPPKWAGKWITIYPDPTVKYGGAAVGGIRVRPIAPTPPEASK